MSKEYDNQAQSGRTDGGSSPPLTLSAMSQVAQDALNIAFPESAPHSFRFAEPSPPSVPRRRRNHRQNEVIDIDDEEGEPRVKKELPDSTDNQIQAGAGGSSSEPTARPVITFDMMDQVADEALKRTYPGVFHGLFPAPPSQNNREIGLLHPKTEEIGVLHIENNEEEQRVKETLPTATESADNQIQAGAGGSSSEPTARRVMTFDMMDQVAHEALNRAYPRVFHGLFPAPPSQNNREIGLLHPKTEEIQVIGIVDKEGEPRVKEGLPTDSTVSHETEMSNLLQIFQNPETPAGKAFKELVRCEVQKVIQELGLVNGSPSSEQEAKNRAATEDIYKALKADQRYLFNPTFDTFPQIVIAPPTAKMLYNFKKVPGAPSFARLKTVDVALFALYKQKEEQMKKEQMFQIQKKWIVKRAGRGGR